LSAEQADEALMLRVRDHDSTEAFGELYDRYAEIALRVARSVCRDAGRAEDAVQEGFLSIWRARAQYRPESGPVKGWMLVHLRHRAVDAVRRDAASRKGEQIALTAPAPDPGAPSPQQVVMAQDENDQMRASIARLPDAQSEVIMLAFYGELTHQEIAEQLSLPPGTVKGRMRLGLHKLRAATDDRDVGPAKTDPHAAPSGRARRTAP
jgi:RNA polymerase sigma-70 factor (ECF subfamily)